jgi:26S proteasome regulatory subunit N7
MVILLLSPTSSDQEMTGIPEVVCAHAFFFFSAEMGPFLETILKSDASTISPSFQKIVPSNLVAELSSKNKENIDSIQTKLNDAIENLGETEVSDLLRTKALYLSKIGAEKALSVAAFEEALKKQAGLGSKIDLRLGLIRVGFFHGDHQLIMDQIVEAKQLSQPLESCRFFYLFS